MGGSDHVNKKTLITEFQTNQFITTAIIVTTSLKGDMPKWVLSSTMSVHPAVYCIPTANRVPLRS